MLFSPIVCPVDWRKCRLHPCSYFIIWMGKARLIFRSGHTEHHYTTHRQSCHVSIHQSCFVCGATFYSVERREVAVAGLAAVSDNWVRPRNSCVCVRVLTTIWYEQHTTDTQYGGPNQPDRVIIPSCDKPTAQNVQGCTGHYTGPAWTVATYVYMYVCMIVFYILCQSISYKYYLALPTLPDQDYS